MLLTHRDTFHQTLPQPEVSAREELGKSWGQWHTSHCGQSSLPGNVSAAHPKRSKPQKNLTLRIWVSYLFPQMSLNYFKLIMKDVEDQSKKAIYCLYSRFSMTTKNFPHIDMQSLMALWVIISNTTLEFPC